MGPQLADLYDTGKQDLVTGSYSPGDIYVFKCKEGRTFEEKKVLVKAPAEGSRLTASSVAVVDWDGDGLLDLVVGNIEGEVLLLKNTGTKKEPKFADPVALEADGKAIKVGGDAGPCVADWDARGVNDLFVGDGQGHLYYYRNVGTKKAPKLAAACEVKPGGGKLEAGTRIKPAVADWRGTGKLDLLFGNFEYKGNEYAGNVLVCPRELEK